MNEDKAKTKWCPLARRFNYCQNRDEKGKPYPQDTCTATDCMMWRWEKRPTGDLPSTTGTAREGYGYCGLAGWPT